MRSNEEAVLSSSPDLEKDYTGRILPEKIKLASEYVERHNIVLDLKLIVKTIFR